LEQPKRTDVGNQISKKPERGDLERDGNDQETKNKRYERQRPLAAEKRAQKSKISKY